MSLGYAVTGVDLSRDLLDELERFKGKEDKVSGCTGADIPIAPNRSMGWIHIDHYQWNLTFT